MMFKSSTLAIIFAIITQSQAKKPSTCTPDFDAMSDSTMCMVDSDKILTTGVSKADIKFILDTHNRMRASVSPPAKDLFKLVWDDKIAAVAQKLTQQCKLFHDPNRNIASYPKVNIGQNLAAGRENWEKAINAWYNEVEGYEYGKGSKSGQVVGHYTQIVFNGAIRIGCGFSKCNAQYNTFYACNYAAVQTEYKRPYKKGEQCSACPKNCKDGLCDCGGLMCMNWGYLDINKCKCKCRKGFGGKDCTKVLICDGKKCYNNGQLDTKTCTCNCVTPGTSGTKCQISEDMSSGKLRCYFAKPTHYGIASSEKCKQYGKQGKDIGFICKSGTGAFGCDQCKYPNIPQKYCPEMCGLCRAEPVTMVRRVDGKVDFHLTWAAYKEGFGNCQTGDCWIGLMSLRKLCKKNCKLQVTMTYKGKTYHADYTTFMIGPKKDNYRLTIGGYHGDAGDSMSINNNMQFSTKNRDNDQWRRQCSKVFTGGWWYKACHHAHPTGLWGSKALGKGINWKTLTTHFDSLSSITMKVSPTS